VKTLIIKFSEEFLLFDRHCCDIKVKFFFLFGNRFFISRHVSDNNAWHLRQHDLT